MSTAAVSNPGTPAAYEHQLQQTLEERITQLPTLTQPQKDYLIKRWLDQLIWMEARATQTQKRHYWARGVSIVCGALLIVLANLAFDNKESPDAIQRIQWLFNGVSLIAFFAFASEGLFKFGEKWQHYRRNAEMLKAEGWKFVGLSDGYSRFDDHTSAFSTFSKRVEDVFAKDIESYIEDVATEAPTN